jgi:hypothetical protein
LTTRSELRAILLVAAALALAAPAASAQISTAPIVVKQKTPKPHLLTFQGQVVRADPVRIVVRRSEDSRFIRTFTYSPRVRDHMLKLLDRGGYQYGDHVKIRYQEGSDVAQEIRGKPSKPR